MPTTESDKLPAPHDAEEALTLLARFAEEHSPDEDGRAKAAERLLADLLALDGKTRIRVQRDEREGGVLVMLHRQVAKVHTDGYSAIVTNRFGRSGKDVPLSFNPLTGQLESTREDAYRAPEPGKPSRRRSVLADVIEAALEVMKGQT